MITQVGAAEVRWSRLAWLFASVEAIAFGAAGALFGASVQRQRAERAEAAARENAAQAEKGRTLATFLKADAPDAPGREPILEKLGPQERQGVDSVAQRHAALARELFP